MAAYDPETINAAVNLVDLAGGDTQLRRVSGEEHAGPCPKCGGEDRFHVTAGWWFCRQCHEKRGDAIAYLQWRDGATFPEACEALGGARDVLSFSRTKNTARSAPTVAHIPDTEPPGELWQARARAMVAHCEALLWQDADAQAYLRGRGLSEDTIRAAHLGWCPGYPPPERWYEKSGDSAARWGLDPAQHPHGVRMARGWVIPCEMAGVIWYVKVRRPQADLDAETARSRDPAKYLCVAGSHKAGAIYGLDDARGAVDVVLAEGEFNALLLRQELAGVASVVSVGDAGNRPGRQAMAVLTRIPRPWAIYDPDEAGQRGAEGLGELWARVRPLAWPWADRGEKYDVNDAHRDGEDLAAWVIPQIGPGDPDKRRAWIEHHLQRLNDAALDAGADEADPSLRAWLVLSDQLRARADRRRVIGEGW
jgi:hypothetical protein